MGPPPPGFASQQSGSVKAVRRWSLLYISFVVQTTKKCRCRTGPVFEVRRRPAGGKVAVPRETSPASSSFPHHEGGMVILHEASRASSSFCIMGNRGGTRSGDSTRRFHRARHFVKHSSSEIGGSKGGAGSWDSEGGGVYINKE